MAKRVIYTGEPKVLGRFGKVKKGQLLLLTEREWYSCREDAGNFKLSAEDKPTMEPVDLKDTPLFRFTTLKWGTMQVLREVHRKGRKQLMAMAEGLALLGIGCPVSQDMDRDELADAVLEAAGNAGWLPD